jgi:hypothetical protein
MQFGLQQIPCRPTSNYSSIRSNSVLFNNKFHTEKLTTNLASDQMQFCLQQNSPRPTGNYSNIRSNAVLLITNSICTKWQLYYQFQSLKSGLSKQTLLEPFWSVCVCVCVCVCVYGIQKYKHNFSIYIYIVFTNLYQRHDTALST